MVCAYVREDNPRALASGLSPVYMHNHTITALKSGKNQKKDAYLRRYRHFVKKRF